MPESSVDLARRRVEIARTTQEHRRHPSDPAVKARLQQQRADYAEAKIVAYVHDVIAGAPPLSQSQLDRLSALLRPTPVALAEAA